MEIKPEYYYKSSSLLQQKIILALQKENAYPHKVTKVKVEETHISWVFLTGKYAYKLKKELKFGKVLNFSTLNLRKKYCQKEVNLNKILCDNMYRGVVKIVEQNGKIRIRDLRCGGKALDYAVKMIEMPKEFRMDNLLFENKIDFPTITKLSEILVKFHKYTYTNNRISQFGQPKAIRMKIRENFKTLSKLVKISGEFEQRLVVFVQNKKSLFYQRIKERKVRAIHGDLYLKNIFVLYPKFYLYDRIEFNDSLRYADVAEDVAHLSMDLDHNQRGDLRKYFLNQYMKKSKDQSLEELIYFLMCYKACMRAKVSFFRATEETNHRKRVQSIKEANEHLQLAASYLDLF
jgi:aminoglycoside phosphotransferase family enzyme